ncbi:ATP phosphoribosyltransferase regulatory subunit [Klebsiella oxytoca]|uniref:Eco57I restriction-modification methylase domain-containing protein n=1 Tax=Klebsiella oxytoca TaxID=571 RepID=UPI0022B77353|nr:type IIL restriction-modification enzyme MmeI [Klebsiella oxytoca]EIY2866855.1 ATP phosphoribosyltransferase regulatory subunit [Klebsiella oxytoca]EKQ7191750.1 ATP phosphoribosyltransferase regulatory subunit [Klebsiella oxytoca]WBD82585.1 ATP phosphoribosyltransferase regulatory subunit [Klebsiella oxytoca]
MSMASIHDDWLSLIDISGPFLAVPVLKDAFPQGLEELDAAKRKRLRQAYDEWREALEQEDPQFNKLHFAWIEEVLSRGLEFDEDGKGDVLKGTDWCTANLNTVLSDHGVALSPNLAIVDEQCANKPLMLIHTYAQDIDLDATLKMNGWVATPADRMVQLCRSLGCRLGLVTNGERWMLVDAPVGAVTSFASWYARLWNQEPITLQAFVHLLGIRRFFVDESEQLPALFDSSLKYQDEVTDALGEQVRRAVEVLIQSLDKADQDRNRELLYNVKESELYEAALTVMMRLVFLLSAEERGLLLLGDERYEANYALSTLRMQLRKVPEEILERRWDAWSRLLAVFRAVFCGVEHESLRLPALGSSLFDPDHFPFLEGRAKGSSWRTDTAKPLPIDNRTVLLLLEAIQQFQGRTLSYRALDVEQIGYVYEGLLERTVRRTDEVTLELDATKKSQYPWVNLAELDSASMNSTEKLVELLQERSGSSISRVRKDLAKAVDDTLADRLLTTCQGDIQLRDRIKPYAHLLRTDPWGYPLVYSAGAFIVTSGSNRRETGTHYTPKSLTETIVTETLTPVAYIGPADGTPREEWRLKSPAELLDLKICDPAMGSGAFLVQACRWLADRLNEAWSLAEANGKAVSVDGVVLDALGTCEQLPRDMDARIVIARRLIAERCLYGVDLNPLAVELAKLSIWLVTLAKGRPFGFLDHSLRCGDSLLGIHRLDQLTQLTMKPSAKGQLRLFGQDIEKAVREAIELRQRLRDMPIRDIHDVEAMAHLDAEARRKLEVSKCIADALIGEVFISGGGVALENALDSLTIKAGQVIDEDRDVLSLVRRRSIDAFTTDLPIGKSARRPFHWPLEFPEVLADSHGGFDAVLGNPPYRHGSRISTDNGIAYLRYLLLTNIKVKGTADLAVHFLHRFLVACRPNGTVGLVTTKSIAEGDNKESGLKWLINSSQIRLYKATNPLAWPGKAALSVAMFFGRKGIWSGKVLLNNTEVVNISASLEAAGDEISMHSLFSNTGICYKGSELLGDGFIVSEAEARKMLCSPPDAHIIKQLMNGKDFSSSAAQSPGRWVIDFGDMGEAEARSHRIPFSIIEQWVKPERAKDNRAARRERYWRFGEIAKGLYSRLQGLEKAVARLFTGEYWFWDFVTPGPVFTNALVIVTSDQPWRFAVLSSTIHEAWASIEASSLVTRFRYTPSRCFETFPFPQGSESLDSFANAFWAYRRDLMDRRVSGLTPIYGELHDPACIDQDIIGLRDMHARLDVTVLDAYGWGDISLNHEFRETKQGVRFTISEAARVEVLQRLSELNRLRYQEELAAGLHVKAAKAKRLSTPRK